MHMSGKMIKRRIKRALSLTAAAAVILTVTAALSGCDNNKGSRSRRTSSR